MASTLGYALRVLKGRLRFPADRACPYCRSTATRAAGRKHLILQLRVCDSCGLKYRYPKDEAQSAARFYDADYVEPKVTQLPNESELPRLMAAAFKGSEFDKPEKVEFIAARVPFDARLLDFGCSFGYLLYQLRARGFTRLSGYELGRSRAAWGRERLGLDIRDDGARLVAEAAGQLDAVLAVHVLEHVADLAATLRDLGALVRRPGGKLFIWTPNAGDAATARHYGGSWAGLVGEPHPLALDDAFLTRALVDHGFEVTERCPPEDEELRMVAVAR